MVYNEIGVVYYHQMQYVEAKEHLTKALALINSRGEEKSSQSLTIIINLANCKRKLK